MFVRNGQVLGSVLVGAEPKAKRPKSTAEEPVQEVAPTPVVEPTLEPSEPKPIVEEPPRGGSNGTREAWATFLTEQGIDYPEDPEEAGRNDLIAIWDNREGGNA